MWCHLDNYDFTNGVKKDAESCPIAHNLRRNGIKASVGTDTVSVAGRNIPLPQAARDFVRNFDAGNAVSPLSFELPI